MVVCKALSPLLNSTVQLGTLDGVAVLIFGRESGMSAPPPPPPMKSESSDSFLGGGGGMPGPDPLEVTVFIIALTYVISQ